VTCYVDESGGVHCIGPMKLDLSFRLKATHHTIQKHVSEAMLIKFGQDENAKTEYVNRLRMLKLNHKETEYDAMKDWLRVLPTNRL
jgi:hypothetical protein